MATPSARPAAASPARTAPPVAGLNRPSMVSATSAIPGNVGKQLTGISDRPSPRAATSRGLLPRHPSHFTSGASSSSTSSAYNAAKIIFVTNLSSNVTARQLRNIYQNAGEIRSIQVYEGGAAIIEFWTAPFQTQQPDAEASSVSDEATQSIVTNQPGKAKDPELRKFFENFGQIVDIGSIGGSLSIRFHTNETAKKAAQQNGKVFNKKPIDIQLTIARRPPSVHAPVFPSESNAFSSENLSENPASGSNVEETLNVPASPEDELQVNVPAIPSQSNAFSSENLPENPESGSNVGETANVPAFPETDLQVGQTLHDTKSRSAGPSEPYQRASTIPTTILSQRPSIQEVLPAAQDRRVHWRCIMFLAFVCLAYHATVNVPAIPETDLQVGQTLHDTKSRSAGASEPYQLALTIPTTAISQQPSIQEVLPAAQDRRVQWRRIMFLAFVCLAFHAVMVLVHYFLEKIKKSAELSESCSGKGKENWKCQISENTVTIEGMTWAYLLSICNAIKIMLGCKYGWGESLTSVIVHSMLHAFIYTLFRYIEAQEIGNDPIYSLMLAHAIVFTADFVSSFVFWYLFGSEVDFEEADPSFDPATLA